MVSTKARLKIIACALATIGSLCASSCSDDPAIGPVEESSLATLILEANCTLLLDCNCSFPEQLTQSCQAPQQELEPFVQAQIDEYNAMGLNYDKACATSHLNWFLACGRTSSQPTCNIYHGTALEGESCSSIGTGLVNTFLPASQCMQGLYCNNVTCKSYETQPPDPCDVDVDCTILPGLDEPCPQGLCSDGLICVEQFEICREPLQENESCGPTVGECAAGLVCKITNVSAQVGECVPAACDIYL